MTTPLGTGTSTTDFTVAVPVHSRTVTGFKYKGKNASGHVNVGDGFTACFALVPVYIQQQTNNGWKLIDTTATNGSGNFDTWVPNKSGKFRAQVKKQDLLAGNSCGAATSKVVHDN